MKQSEFEIFYRGPILDSGKMSVNDLAPSLISLGTLFEEVNKVLNNKEVSLKLEVKSGFEKGSFGVYLQVSLDLLNQVQCFFKDIEHQDAIKLVGFILGAGGLVEIIKKLKGRKIKDINEVSKNEISIFVEGENNEIRVNKNVFNIYNDVNTRKALRGFVHPLKTLGIDSIQARNKTNLIIEKKDVPFFEVEEEIENDDVLIEEKTEETFLSIHTINFNKDRKWRFSDGQNSYWVTIDDEYFLSQVDHNSLAFCKGDILKVLLKRSYWQTLNGLRSESNLIKVLDHIQAPRQQVMNFKGITKSYDKENE